MPTLRRRLLIGALAGWGMLRLAALGATPALALVSDPFGLEARREAIVQATGEAVARGAMIVPAMAVPGLLDKLTVLLELDEVQVDRLQALRAQLVADLLTVPDEGESMQTTSVELLEEKYRALISVLLEDKQQERLDELKLEAQGAICWLIEEIAQQLQLSEEQQQQVAVLYGEYEQRVDQASEQYRDQPVLLLTNVQAARTQMNESAGALLTEEQRGTWQRMQGAGGSPFALSQMAAQLPQLRQLDRQPGGGPFGSRPGAGPGVAGPGGPGAPRGPGPGGPRPGPGLGGPRPGPGLGGPRPGPGLGGPSPGPGPGGPGPRP